MPGMAWSGKEHKKTSKNAAGAMGGCCAGEIEKVKHTTHFYYALSVLI